jgi:hypothetical protein
MRLGVHERYKNDPTFRTIVHAFYDLIAQGETTPTEVREAAMLALEMYERNTTVRPRPVQDMSGTFPHIPKMYVERIKEMLKDAEELAKGPNPLMDLIRGAWDAPEAQAELQRHRKGLEDDEFVDVDPAD